MGNIRYIARSTGQVGKSVWGDIKETAKNIYKGSPGKKKLGERKAVFKGWRNTPIKVGGQWTIKKTPIIKMVKQKNKIKTIKRSKASRMSNAFFSRLGSPMPKQSDFMNWNI